jgi:hypothetical protein
MCRQMRLGCKGVVGELELAAEDDPLKGILARFVPHSIARLDDMLEQLEHTQASVDSHRPRALRC